MCIDNRLTFNVTSSNVSTSLFESSQAVHNKNINSTSTSQSIDNVNHQLCATEDGCMPINLTYTIVQIGGDANCLGNFIIQLPENIPTVGQWGVDPTRIGISDI